MLEEECYRMKMNVVLELLVIEEVYGVKNQKKKELIIGNISSILEETYLILQVLKLLNKELLDPINPIL